MAGAAIQEINVELSLVGENLLHPSHPEHGFPQPTRSGIDRSVWLELAWHR